MTSHWLGISSKINCNEHYLMCLRLSLKITHVEVFIEIKSFGETIENQFVELGKIQKIFSKLILF